MTNQQNGGAMRFEGILSEFSNVQVKDQTSSDSVLAAVDSAKNSFEAFLKVIPGTNNITITATDYSGNNNKQTNNYNISVTNGINNTLAFDNNGNTISATNPAVTYDWDAADRLVKITKEANITEFVYDGLSRRVAEKLNGTVIKRWLWDGTELCEERNAAGGTVTKRFFPQGEQINGTNYYFTKDHLGSIREMTDAAGVVKARYDYDPYGRRTKLSGSMDADFGFTGHYLHQSSGLYLAMYRAYDPNLARWLSRDPIAEKGGLNLYGYVLNNPINYWDPLGLGSWGECLGWGAGAGIGAGAGLGIASGLGKLGGTLGSFAGPIGTVVGAIVGGLVGYGLGELGKPDESVPLFEPHFGNMPFPLGRRKLINYGP